MKNWMDSVLFALFSFITAGILIKFLYAMWLYNLYTKHIATIA